MALDYQASADLMTDPAFQGRVKVACLKYATYIMDEAASTPAHATRVKWAQATFANPLGSAVQVTPVAVMDGQVQADGAAITDPNLQTAVETSVNKMI